MEVHLFYTHSQKLPCKLQSSRPSVSSHEAVGSTTGSQTLAPGRQLRWPTVLTVLAVARTKATAAGSRAAGPRVRGGPALPGVGCVSARRAGAGAAGSGLSPRTASSAGDWPRSGGACCSLSCCPSPPAGAQPRATAKPCTSLNPTSLREQVEVLLRKNIQVSVFTATC